MENAKRFYHLKNEVLNSKSSNLYVPSNCFDKPKKLIVHPLVITACWKFPILFDIFSPLYTSTSIELLDVPIVSHDVQGL